MNGKYNKIKKREANWWNGRGNENKMNSVENAEI